MEASRAGTGELLVGVSGLLLLLVMFLPWFGVDASFTLPGTGEPVTVADRSLNAWESLGLADVLLAATAALALCLLVVPARPKRALALATLAGAALSALAIVYRLLDPPSLTLIESPDTASEAASRLGAFFGLLCTGAIAWGANRASAPPEAPPAHGWQVLGRLASWSRADIEAQCARAWRNYDRRLATHYKRYFERHPDLLGDQRLSARDLVAALPPGWDELADAMPKRRWERHHLSAKSSQTLAVGLLGQAARSDPSLVWLFDALGLASSRAPRLEFEYTVASDLLGERSRRTSIDVLVEDPHTLICVETKWREPGIAACSCRGPGVGPLEPRCSAHVENRESYWAAAREVFGPPGGGHGNRCPISPMYELVRTAAAARALAEPDRLAVLALIYDADNPYFKGSGDWPGWPKLLREAVELNADPAEFRFVALSWQELLPQLPLDDATRVWAQEKHRLGGAGMAAVSARAWASESSS